MEHKKWNEKAGVHVTVDGDGVVTSYHRQLPEAEYPSAVPEISLEEASRRLKDGLQVELQYYPLREGSRVKGWMLGYTLISPDTLDAKTGHFLVNGKPADEWKRQYLPVPKGEEEFRPANQNLTAEEAARRVETLFAIPEGRTLQRKTLSTHGIVPARPVWHLNWVDAENRGPFFNETMAMVDVATGQILEFRKQMPHPMNMPESGENQSDSPATSEETVRRKAFELINRLYPDAAGSLRLVDPNPDAQPENPKEPRFAFLFQRFFNGIPVSGDTVSLTLDAQGWAVGYFASGSRLDDQEMAKLHAKITAREAARIIQEHSKVELQYQTYGGYYTDSGRVEPSIKLAYALSVGDRYYGAVVNAEDGNLASPWKPEGFPDPGVQPSDIEGHWAEDDLKILAEYRVLTPDADGKVYPERTVTVGEWLKMIAKAVDPLSHSYVATEEGKSLFADVPNDSELADTVRMLVYKKWLEAAPDQTLGVDQPLTKDRLAELLIRMVRYEKLSEVLERNGDLLSFADADLIEHRGDASLAVRLGLLGQNDGRFDPRHEITRAEVANVIMRLVRLQGRLDQFG